MEPASAFLSFQFLGIPPKGEQSSCARNAASRMRFPISRDPPEGGTSTPLALGFMKSCFQFLGIPPKGEPALEEVRKTLPESFQFLGIPPKGELEFHFKDPDEYLFCVSNF